MFATLKFDEEGVAQLGLVLRNLRNATFDLQTKTEKKTVILLDADEEGQATLIDFDHSTGESKVGSSSFIIDLYDPNVSLTYC
jgi:hypothetical protein